MELGTDRDTLDKARLALQAARLVAYDPPVYRVLDVPDRPLRTVSGTGRASGKAADPRGSGEAPATPEEVARILDEAFGRRGQA